MQKFLALLRACRSGLPTMSTGYKAVVIAALLVLAPLHVEAKTSAGATSASAYSDQSSERSVDPWEKFNRGVYKFNDTFDHYLLKPVAKGYRKVMPRPLDQGVTNFFRNLSAPLTMVNDILQFKPRHLLDATARFLLNSTFGLFGLMDPASAVGLPYHPEDFGQTLAVWGVKQGPYVVLPFLGGRTLRDAITMIPDSYLSYYHYVDDQTVRYSLMGTDVVDTRADAIPSEQLVTGDRYVFLRDAYLQRRNYLIHDGKVKPKKSRFGEEDFGDFDNGQ